MQYQVLVHADVFPTPGRLLSGCLVFIVCVRVSVSFALLSNHRRYLATLFFPEYKISFVLSMAFACGLDLLLPL